MGELDFDNFDDAQYAAAQIDRLIDQEQPSIIAISLQEKTGEQIYDFVAAKPNFTKLYQTCGLAGSVCLGILVNTNVDAKIVEDSEGSYQCKFWNLKKGAIWVKLAVQTGRKVRYVTIASSHLPHHPKGMMERIECMNAALDRLYDYNAAIVYMGDLNFRVDNDDTNHSKTDLGAYIRTLSCENKHKQLRVGGQPAGCHTALGKTFGCLDDDQLVSNLHQVRYVTESPISFCPSCRFDEKRNKNGDGEYFYDAKRVPSWCDRVLYRQGNVLKPLEYGSLSLGASSDHLSVYHTFSVK
jgi:hypothetical protein